MSQKFTTLEHAQRLAAVLHAKHWKADSPDWRVGDDLQTVLLQIDNITAGLVRPELAASVPGAPWPAETVSPCAQSGEARKTAHLIPNVVSLSERL